ncbi:Uncharacterised protein [Shigella sonnei]|nr:Uncharacterised protein [Shigella sonnei]CSQ80005.1 Uncharacterised protein [Shigella sonnei]CSR94832.1 Uncharacterised protein [Shigella sonnei]
MLDAQTVNLARRTLDQPQIVCPVQMQGNAVIINAVSCFFSPARVGRLGREGNLHRFCHFSYPSL